MKILDSKRKIDKKSKVWHMCGKHKHKGVDMAKATKGNPEAESREVASEDTKQTQTRRRKVATADTKGTQTKEVAETATKKTHKKKVVVGDTKGTHEDSVVVGDTKGTHEDSVVGGATKGTHEDIVVGGATKGTHEDIVVGGDTKGTHEDIVVVDATIQTQAQLPKITDVAIGDTRETQPFTQQEVWFLKRFCAETLMNARAQKPYVLPHQMPDVPRENTESFNLRIPKKTLERAIEKAKSEWPDAAVSKVRLIYFLLTWFAGDPMDATNEPEAS